jgi:hypothetical protein
VDIPDREIFQAPMHYAMDAPSYEPLSVLGAKLNVVHIRERGSCPLLDWHFENEYWLDARSGFSWKSRQMIHPGLDAVEIVVFRRPD